MTNKNRVTLSDNTIKQLKEVGEPFESVDDCLKRILGCDCIKNEMEKQTSKEQEE